MDRYLIYKVKGDGPQIFASTSRYVVTEDELINRLRSLKVYLDNFDLKNVFKILTGD